MRNFIFAFLLLFLLVLSSFAQNPATTETPSPDDGNILKISTTLIQVDVTVTNKNGKIVKDLKPEDFEVFENGKKQNVTSFSFIGSVSLNVSAKVDKSSSITKNPWRRFLRIN